MEERQADYAKLKPVKETVVAGQNVLSFDKPTTLVTFKDFTLTQVKCAGV